MITIFSIRDDEQWSAYHDALLSTLCALEISWAAMRVGSTVRYVAPEEEIRNIGGLDVFYYLTRGGV